MPLFIIFTHAMGLQISVLAATIDTSLTPPTTRFFHDFCKAEIFELLYCSRCFSNAVGDCSVHAGEPLQLLYVIKSRSGPRSRALLLIRLNQVFVLIASSKSAYNAHHSTSLQKSIIHSMKHPPAVHQDFRDRILPLDPSHADVNNLGCSRTTSSLNFSCK